MLQNLGDILITIYKILWKEGGFLEQRRTDLALEAHALWRAAAENEEIEGLRVAECCRRGCGVTTVRVESETASRALGKPRGTYVTLDLRACRTRTRWLDGAAGVLGAELRALLPREVRRALVVGLGNRAMTPDAVGPKSTDHILVTRHLATDEPFSALAAVSVLTPSVLGRTGVEAAELVRAAAQTVQPEVIVAVDALCAQRLGRVCTTVQLSDAGIVPGSGVGNHRLALTRETLGVPVVAVGVPTVVDAATLTRDVLEEAGAPELEPEALRGHRSVTVTTRDIDAQVEDLARLVGFGIDLALQPALSLADVRALAE